MSNMVESFVDIEDDNIDFVEFLQSNSNTVTPMSDKRLNDNRYSSCKNTEDQVFHGSCADNC